MPQPYSAFNDLRLWFPIKKGLWQRVTVDHIKAVDGISLHLKQVKP
jgi:microcin C transport system ATP-binding protein